MRASLATGEIGTLADKRDNPASIVVDASSVYWTEVGEAASGTIQRLPLAGGAVEYMAGGQNPGTLAVAAGNIYWSTYFAPTGGSIMKMALAGGTATPLLMTSHWFSSLVADGASLYCSDGRAILRFAADGRAVTAFATEGLPARLAVDETRIYFTTAEGAVMAMAKP